MRPYITQVATTTGHSIDAWQDIAMDFIEGLWASKGKNSILLVIDRFTKNAHFIPLAHPYTASKVA